MNQSSRQFAIVITCVSVVASLRVFAQAPAGRVEEKERIVEASPPPNRPWIPADVGRELSLREKVGARDLSRAVVYEHHENFDGTGYPQGLKGDDISNLARVVSIADVFDALTTNRSYHRAIAPKEAMNTMFGMQPGKFDPAIFKSFNKNFSKTSKLELPPGFDPCSPQAVLSLIKK